MERDLKFRAFNPITKKFEFLDIIHKHTIMTSLQIPSRGSWDDLMPFQQYIGAKDKNKTPIYEGDIIKFKDVICEVYFDFAGFRIKPMPNLDVNNICTHKDFEIIGNIHQNPELLSA